MTLVHDDFFLTY